MAPESTGVSREREQRVDDALSPVGVVLCRDYGNTQPFPSWPTQAGGQLTSVYHSAHTLQPWPGFGVMCLFVAIVYAIAWTLLDRRDA